jgi:hypothetical protein
MLRPTVPRDSGLLVDEGHRHVGRPCRRDHALDHGVDDLVDGELALDGGRHRVDGRQLAVLPEELALDTFDGGEHDDSEHDYPDDREQSRNGLLVKRVVQAFPLDPRFEGDDPDHLEDDDGGDRDEDADHLEATQVRRPSLGIDAGLTRQCSSPVEHRTQ